MVQETLDTIDRKILDVLQHDASIPRKKLAELCNISEATCSRRIATLERQGLMPKPVIILNPKKFGLSLSVFVLVMLEKEIASEMRRLTEQWRKNPHVLSIDLISGEYDYIMHLAMRDMEQYQAFAEEYLAHDPLIKRYLSLFQMKEVKHSSAIPLNEK